MGTDKGEISLPSLQEKFVKSGLKDFTEQETLEFLLSLYGPDKNHQKLAGRIVERFHTIKQMLDSPANQVKQIPGLNSNHVFFFEILRELCKRYTTQAILERPLYHPGQIIFDYLYREMRNLPNDHFKLITLDIHKKIIETTDLFANKPDVGPPQSTRIIVEQAIKSQAMYFVVVHNHSSGDPMPSQTDKDVTRDLVFAGMIIQIEMLDHVIFGNNTYFSFAHERLIEEYEAEFQDLKLRGTFEAKRRLKAARNGAGKL